MHTMFQDPLICRILPHSIYNIKPFIAHYVPTSSNMSHTPSQHLQYLLWFTHIRHATNIFIVSLTFYIITHICLGLRKNTKLYLHWFILQNLPIIYGLLSVFVWQKGFVSSQLITSSHINKNVWTDLKSSDSESKIKNIHSSPVWFGFSHSNHIWLYTIV